MQPRASDLELSRLIQQGNEEAFELLFRENYPRLVAYARRFLHDKDLSENAVQAVFAGLWEKRGKLSITSLQSYMAIAVRNKCINELKANRNITLMGHIPPEQEDTVDLPLDEETIKHVQGIISLMPAQRQKIFRLNRYEGLKYKEIASLLGISIKTVEAQMGKALKFLRENIKKELINFSGNHKNSIP